MYILESMKTAVINFKTDPRLKAAAQARAKKLGIPLSAILHNQLRAFAGGTEVKIEYPAEKMTPHLERLIEESEASGTVGPFDSVKEARAYFEAHNHED
jgi:antitoxin component of RelBE/YafQ-DinJ toxin-antitoxin module